MIETDLEILTAAGCRIVDDVPIHVDADRPFVVLPAFEPRAIVCGSCGHLTPLTRVTKVYCSDTCKRNALRARKRLRGKTQRAKLRLIRGGLS